MPTASRFTLIDKNSERPLSSTETLLSPNEQTSLAALVDGKTLAAHDRTLVASSLQKVQEKGAWLLDRRGNVNVVLAVVERTGRLHLREFVRTREATPIFDRALEEPWTKTVLDFHHAFGSLAETSGDGGSGTGGDGESGRSFGGFLIELIHRAKLTDWCLPAPTLAQQKQRLRDAAGSFQVAEGLSLADYIFDYSPHNRRRVESQLRDLLAWPSGGRPYGLFHSVSDAVDRDARTIRVQGTRSMLRLLGELSVIGTNTPTATFLTLNTFSESAQLERGYFGPINASALRIAGSDCLVPIESDPEAAVFSVLRKYQNGLHKQGDEMKIRKPVRPEVIGGVQIRPDFWLELNQSRAVVEVMGFDDPDYRTRKIKLKEVVLPHADWVEVDATIFPRIHDWLAELGQFEIQLGKWIAKSR